MAARATTPCPATAARTRWSAARATTRSTLATASVSSSSAAAAGTRSRPTRRTGSPAARRSCAEGLTQPEVERPQPRAVAGVSRWARLATLVDLVDVPDVFDVVGLAARLGLEPCVEDLLEQRLARPPQRQRQDVRVVPLPGAAGRLRVVTESGSHAGHLVRRDRGAGAGPAAHDALLRAPARDIARRRLAGPSPVVPLAGGESAMRHHFVPARAQCIEHRLRDARPLVGCDSDLQVAEKRTLWPPQLTAPGRFSTT